MKISFPKYGGELVTQKRLAPWIIAFVAIVLVAGVCGSFLLGNKWLLAIAVLGIAGIVLCIGVAVAIFPTQSEVYEAPSAPIEENMPESISQWDYRPSKPIRGRAVLDRPSTQTSDGLSPDRSEINNNVWLPDNSLDGAVPAFIDGLPETEKTPTEALPQTTDPVRSAPTVDDEASDVRLKSYRQRSRRR
jgi:hypothetical protein